MQRQTSNDEWIDPVAADLKARSIRGGLITAVVQVSRVILMLLSQIVLARLLAPADFGMVAMVAPVIGFVQIIADLGITQAIVSAPVLRMGQINAFFWLNLAVSLMLAGIAAACAPLIAWFYSEPRLAAVVLSCSGLILVSGAGLVQAALLSRRLLFGTVAAIDVIALLLSVLTGIIAARARWGYWSLIVAQAAFGLASTGLTMTLAPWRPSWPGWDRKVLSLVRFGGAVTASNLVNYVNVSIDNVIVGSRLGKVPLGFYDRAWKLAVQPITQIQAPFSRVAVPAMSRLIGSPDTYRNAFLRILQIMMAFSTPAMICAALQADVLVGLALGARWTSIVPLVAWMCFSGVATPVNSATFWLLVTQGRVREQAQLSVAAAVINIAAYVIGVRFGLVGLAALSVVSVYVLQMPMLVGVAVRRGPVRLRDVGPLLTANAAAGLVTAGALLVMRRWAEGLALLAMAAPTAMLVNTLVLLCLSPSRRHLLAGWGLVMASLRRSRPEQPLVSEAI